MKRNLKNIKNIMNLKNLLSIGFNSFFEDHFREFSGDGFIPGRIAVQNKTNYIVYSEHGELDAEVSGKFMFDAEGKDDYPAVGDWVVLRPLLDEQKGIIEKVLPRQTSFSRKEAGAKTEKQVLASNIDIVFIMTSLNQDFNLRRIERYLVLANECGISPVIVLSKSDLCEDVEEKINEVDNISGGVPVHAISSITKTGIDEISKYITDGKTIAVLGSSGVGKSTFINVLLGENELETGEVSGYKDKGHHITTKRELIVLPSGGLIIDTPGMRELQLWEGDGGLDDLFDDIARLILQCKFSDCTHKSEPGCAVRKAIKSGELDEERFRSYQKMKREVQYFEFRKDHLANIQEKKKWKKIHKQVKEIYKMRANRK